MNLSTHDPRTALMAAAVLLSLGAAPAWGQEVDHSMHHPVEPAAPVQETPAPQDPHASHHMPPPAKPAQQEPSVDHSVHAPAESASATDEPAD